MVVARVYGDWPIFKGSSPGLQAAPAGSRDASGASEWERANDL